MNGEDEDIPDDDLLPCGCVFRYSIVEGVRTMTLSPCHQDCTYVQFVLERGREQGTSISYLER